MTKLPNGISVEVQYDIQLHTILHKPFLIGLGIGLGLC